ALVAWLAPCETVARLTDWRAYPSPVLGSATPDPSSPGEAVLNPTYNVVGASGNSVPVSQFKIAASRKFDLAIVEILHYADVFKKALQRPATSPVATELYEYSPNHTRSGMPFMVA